MNERTRMSYYTERHGKRSPIEKTYKITPDRYALLLDCCKTYLNHIAWKFPENCPDGKGICGIDFDKLRTTLKYEIPNLYFNERNILDLPTEENETVFFAIFDLIEYIYKNGKDISNKEFHNYFGHYDFHDLQSHLFIEDFLKEINALFQKTGLSYHLTEDGIVERIIDNSVLNAETEELISQIQEKGLQELLNDAISLYKTPSNSARQDSVEKIWDAFERLKTYYDPDKRKSAEQIVNDMAKGNPHFKDLFDKEFKELKNIGNNYRIRHHEREKIDITEIEHYDYLFNRCLSLIATALRCIEKHTGN